MSGLRDENLRTLLREAEASPGAAAWSRLANALARGEEPLRAYEAACRALAFDPADVARELVFPVWGQPRGATVVHGSVPWRGLRDLSRLRPIGAAPVRPRSPIFDLGAGVVAFVARSGDLVAVSALSDAELWTQPAREDALLVTPVGTHLVQGLKSERGRARLAILDRAGQVVASPTLALPATHELDHATAVDGETFAVLTEDATGPPGPLSSKNRAVVFARVSGVVTGEVAAARAPRWLTSAVDGCLVLEALAADDRSVLAVEPTGRERWRVDVAEQLQGAADGALLFAQFGPSLRRVEVATGRELAPCPITPPVGSLIATDGAIGVVGELGRSLEVLDRATFAPLWRKELPGRFAVVSTADAILAVGMRGREGVATEVTSYDPTTGAELSRLDVATSDALASPALVAGLLLLPTRAPRGPSSFVAIS